MTKPKSKLYRAFRYTVLSLAAAYMLLLIFPQVLFAHEVSYKNFTVYSREPLDTQSVQTLLDKVEVQLAKSALNTSDVKPKFLFTNSHGFYSALSLYVGGNSFGKGFPLLPTTNVFINKTDVGQDLVLRKAPTNNQRSLSGVLSHEVAHLLIRNRFGYWRNFTILPGRRKVTASTSRVAQLVSS